MEAKVDKGAGRNKVNKEVRYLYGSLTIVRIAKCLKLP
jgi:hypothetical protein